ncbi:MAG: hypothetical protein AAGC72_08965 [Planctomycetota bacterium]
MIAQGINRFHRKKILQWRVRFLLASFVFSSSCYITVLEPFGATFTGITTVIAIVSFLAALVYALTVFGRSYCVFMPYFSKSLRTDNLPSTYCIGHMIASNLDELDQLASDHDVQPLSRFGYKDSFTNKRIDWHPANQGLETINWLIANRGQDDAVVQELQAIAKVLRVADKLGITFCFHLKFIDGTNAMEHQQREGSYW